MAIRAGSPDCRRPGASALPMSAHATPEADLMAPLWRALIRKLQLHNRAELVRYAMEHGLDGSEGSG